MKTCNTCSTPVSSLCVIYQGKSLYFSDKLEDNTINSIFETLTLELTKINEVLDTPIDGKGLNLGTNVSNLAGYVQALIDKVGQLSNKATPTPQQSVIDISSTELASTCGESLVTVEQAILLILNELASINAKLNNTNSNVYTP